MLLLFEPKETSLQIISKKNQKERIKFTLSISFMSINPSRERVIVLTRTKATNANLKYLLFVNTLIIHLKNSSI